MSPPHREAPLGPETPDDDAIPSELVDRALGEVFRATAPPELSPELPSRPDEPPAGPLPERLGRYRVVREIARGGLGIVYEAHDDRLERRIALKVLGARLEHDATARARLAEEAQICGQLPHPGIVPVHELGALDDGCPYLAMRLVEGRTLAEILAARAGDRRGADSVGTFEAICQAVAYAHSRRVIHRDLKPANVMVGEFGEVQVMDWGLAKVLDASRIESRSDSGSDSGSASDAAISTRASETIRTIRSGDDSSRSISGTVMGTPAYMAPEQARGEVESLDERADVFGLGAILCEILTGSPPYSGDTTRAIVDNARAGRVDAALARLAVCGASDELIAIASSCLAADRRERPRDAGAVASRIGEHLRSREERARRAELDAAKARERAAGERRARRLTTVIALLVAALVSGGAILWLTGESERRERLALNESQVRVLAGEASRLARDAAGAEEPDPSTRESALRAARSAAALLDAEARPELRAEISSLVADAERELATAAFLARLSELRSPLAAAGESVVTRDAEYVDAFREHLEVDLDAGDPGAIAARIRETGEGAQIAFALDDLYFLRAQGARSDRDRILRALEIAKLVDPDPFRTRIRELAATGDGAALESSIDAPETQSASAETLVLLSYAISRTSFGDPVAAELLDEHRLRFPGDFWLHLTLGSYLYRAKRYENAVRQVSVALAVRPRHSGARAALALALWLDDAADEARRVLAIGLEMAPDSRPLLNTLGAIQADSDDVEGAAATYRALVENDPTNARMQINLANVSRRLGDLRAAIEFYSRAGAQGYALAHYRLGEIRYELGDYEAAAECFRESIRCYPRFLASNDAWLADSLRAAGRLDEANETVVAALAQEPGNSHLLAVLGKVLRDRGEVCPAIQAFARSVGAAPAERDATRALLDMLGTPDESASACAGELAALASALGTIIEAGRAIERRGRTLFVECWIRAPSPELAPLAMSTARDLASDGSDAESRVALARALAASGDDRAALATFEDIALEPEAPADVERRIEAIRARLWPDLPTLATIDAAVGAQAPSPETAAAWRGAIGAGDARLAYLEARILQARGEHGGALRALARVIERDRSRPEPFVAYWKSALVIAGEDAARELLSTVLLPGGPERTLPIAPLTPTLRATISTFPATTLALEASAYAPVDPRAPLAATRWQIRAAGASWNASPTLDVVTRDSARELDLPPGLLIPGVEYTARCLDIDAAGRASGFSEEALIPAAYIEPCSIVRVELAALFDRDVIRGAPIRGAPIRGAPIRGAPIRGAKDDEGDFFDVSGYELVIDGFDGSGNPSADVRGLPEDGAVGVHRLAPHDRANAVTLTRTSGALRIELPPQRYIALRFLISGANGTSRMPIAILYDDGAREEHEILCPDWFDDPPDIDSGGDGYPGSSIVLDGMDRWIGRRVDRRRDAALFEAIVPADPRRRAVAVSIEPRRENFGPAEKRFHLFAVAGVTIGGPPSPR